MRLRLSIRRHGLPETLITWAIDTTSSPTVYQLLEQVNEVVPIESDGQWGLEDYAVELKGSNNINYECLHFQYITSILKEDDEIIIRCLHSNEIRKRSFSGRFQITADGKRLFDGVPWGRPLLRANSTRPSIKILPKNSSGLTYNSNFEEKKNTKPLREKRRLSKKVIIQSDRKSDCDDDSESDENYVPENDFDRGSESDMDYLSEEISDEERITIENNGLDEEKDKENKQSDLVSTNKKLTTFEHNFSKRNEVNDGSSRIFDLQEQTYLLHSAFPTSSLAVCKYVLTGTNGDIAEAWEAMSIGFPASKSRNEVISYISEENGKSSDKKIVSQKALALISPGDPENDMIISSKDDHILEHFDKEGLPPGSITSGQALSCMTKAANKLKNFPKIFRSVPSLDSHAIQSSYDGMLVDGDERIANSARKDKNVNFANGRTGRNGLQSNSQDKKIDSDLSSSSLSSASSEYQTECKSDSCSDISDDGSRSSLNDKQKPEVLSSKTNPTTPNVTESALSKKASSKPTVAPGQGKKATQLRNKRKRISNLIRRQKEKGILPVGISKEEFMAMYDNRNPSTSTKRMSPESEREIPNHKSLNKAGIDEEFQRRRKVLLDSIACGGIDISSNLPRSEEQPPIESKLNKVSDSEIAPHTQAIIFQPDLESSKAKEQALLGIEIEKTPAAVKVPNIHCSKSSISQVDQLQFKELDQEPTKLNQRSMLNLDVGRRMVFAAMGFKPPVTEQDKELIRKKLKNKLNSSRKVENVEPEPKDVENDTNDSEAWRDKIIYRAKECVQADVELSEPPFPFVQRWDPQQTCKKRKNNSNSRTQNDDQYESFVKRQKKNGDKYSHENPEKSLDLSNNGIISSQDFEEPNDQVPLPDDPLSLPNLNEEQIKVGMIIIFKQLEVSAASRWQPQISDYKTATVISTVRGKIQVQLARRDFHTAEKLYNEQGERIYSGFDTIDIDETEDDGWRELLFNELVEPKILKDIDSNDVEVSQT